MNKLYVTSPFGDYEYYFLLEFDIALQQNDVNGF
jgi:hypothetical protein